MTDSVEKSDIRQWSAAKRFTLRQLSSATQNFKNVVGEGGFGPVYFGALPGGQEIAVKLRADKSRIGVSAFGNEVRAGLTSGVQVLSRPVLSRCLFT